MAINLQGLIKSQFGVRAVSFLGRTVPPAVGYKIADRAAGWVANRRRSDLIRAIRTNQWVIRGAGPDKEELDRAVLETLKNIAHSLYSLHHYIHDPTVTRSLVDLSPMARRLVERPEFSGRGLMLVGLHLSSFDLILQSMVLQGLKVFVLTIPDPKNGRRLEFEMRKRTGMNLVPASISGMKQALKHLESGGVVLTGIDRPLADAKTRPRFFGLPSALPVHHVYLARKARVPIMIVAARTGIDGCYHVRTSEPIEMESYADQGNGVLRNAEQVLGVAEKFILQAPEQWSISLPVWPDLLDSVPN
jgi:phosphatidylinositol dimannoside acyltransferase